MYVYMVPSPLSPAGPLSRKRDLFAPPPRPQPIGPEVKSRLSPLASHLSSWQGQLCSCVPELRKSCSGGPMPGTFTTLEMILRPACRNNSQ